MPTREDEEKREYKDTGLPPPEDAKVGGMGDMEFFDIPKVGDPTLTEQGAVMNLLTAADNLPDDMVVLPQHYAQFNIEPIRFICENGLNFFQGNIVKYILRYKEKNGLEDLRKAARYLDMFIRFVQGDKDWWRKPGMKEATS